MQVWRKGSVRDLTVVVGETPEEKAMTWERLNENGWWEMQHRKRNC